MVSMVMTNAWLYPTHALHLMKADYYLELTCIINCICLYVRWENGYKKAEMPKIGFSYFATPPTLVNMVTRKTNVLSTFFS